MPTSTSSIAPVRVPQITAYFWLVKILTTGAGETTSDYLGHKIGPVAVVIGGIAAMAAAFVVQFRMRRYVAWAYWLAVSMVAIFGTMAADALHYVGLGYIRSTFALTVLLGIIFLARYQVEKTISIHSITTARREAFYWATAVPATACAVGTAAGDLTAATFGWGYLKSGIRFTVAIALVGIAYYSASRAPTKESQTETISTILWFWLAYILTRPLGASFADWMGTSHRVGGLGWGDGPVSVVLWVVIFAFVWYLNATRKDVQDEEPVRRAGVTGGWVMTGETATE